MLLPRTSSAIQHTGPFAARSFACATPTAARSIPPRALLASVVSPQLAGDARVPSACSSINIRICYTRRLSRFALRFSTAACFLGKRASSVSEQRCKRRDRRGSACASPNRARAALFGTHHVADDVAPASSLRHASNPNASRSARPSLAPSANAESHLPRAVSMPNKK
jgi:hypothetical protein